jgi:hypothetical protein
MLGSGSSGYDPQEVLVGFKPPLNHSGTCMQVRSTLDILLCKCSMLAGGMGGTYQALGVPMLVYVSSVLLLAHFLFTFELSLVSFTSTSLI